MVANSPGIFTANQQGSGPAVVQNFVSVTSVPENTVIAPAKPGQTVILYGTGLGPVAFDETGPPKNGIVGIAKDFEVNVGGKPAKVTYSGRSPCCSGLDQINFIVPMGLDGCYVPIYIKDGGAISNFATMSIGTGPTCADVTGFSGSDLAKIGAGKPLKFGAIILSHTGGDSPRDSAGALFAQYGSDFVRSQGFRRPSVGSCVVTIAKGIAKPVDPITWKPLDAGPLVEIKGGPAGKTVQLTAVPEAPGFYDDANPLPAGFIGAGKFMADDASGGKDVGAFSISATFGAPLVWTNQSGISVVDRGKGVNVTWTGGTTGDLVQINGNSFAIDSSSLLAIANASFSCLADVADGNFTVTPPVLQSLPATSGVGFGTLSVSSFNLQRITPPQSGLDDLFFINTSSNNQTSVTYK